MKSCVNGVWVLDDSKSREHTYRRTEPAMSFEDTQIELPIRPDKAVIQA